MKMTDQQSTKEITLSFEAALKELEEIVRKMESGQVPLEEAIAFYERGTELRERCEGLLKSAQLKIEEVTLDAQKHPKVTLSDLEP